MPKYEEILISEHGDLTKKNKEIIKDIENLLFYMSKTKSIYKSINFIKFIFLYFCTNKINQFSRINNSINIKLKKLIKEFHLIDCRLIDINITLFKYYDKQIKECIDSLGIDHVKSLEDLLVINNDKIKKKFDQEF